MKPLPERRPRYLPIPLESRTESHGHVAAAQQLLGRTALRWGMVPEYLAAVGAAGFHGAIGVENDLPAPPVDARFMMKLAEQPTIIDRSFATVAFVPDVVHIRG